jgi:hypothetical protein
MELESVKNGKEYMIMMFTMIWANLTRKLLWLVQFLGDQAPCLILEGEEPAENQLAKVSFQTLLILLFTCDSKDFGIVAELYFVIMYMNRSKE